MVRKNKTLIIAVLFALVLPIFTACAQEEGEVVAGTAILLVRHGETDWNALGYLQGWADTTLNPVGLSEIEELGASWREKVGMNVDVIYSSPLNRTKQSAEILAKNLSIHPFEIRFEPDLREFSIGVLTGVPSSELKANPDFLAIYKNWSTDTDYAQPSGPAAMLTDYTKHYLEGKEFPGESLNTCRNRVWNALEKIVSENKGKTVVISTHGGVIGMALCVVTDTPIEKYNKLVPSNASVTQLGFADDGSVTWVNAPKE
jgi:broad specificity phosphatase PhoE